MPNSRTSLDGLWAFDNDGDGALTAQDTSFARFLMWRDANGNGLSDAGETQSLSDADVTSFQLEGSTVRPDFAAGSGNEVLGATTIDFADGSQRAVYDVALGLGDDGTDTPVDVPAQPIAQPNPIEDPVSIGTASGGTTAPAKAAGSASADAIDTSAGSMRSARGTLDGPSGEVVATAPASTSGYAWWRDAAIVGSTLADLAMPLGSDDRSLGANLSSPVAAGLDAASLQRQMLLRQSIAAMQSGASGGSAAIWARAGTSPDQLAMPAMSSQTVETAPQPALV